MRGRLLYGNLFVDKRENLIPSFSNIASVDKPCLNQQILSRRLRAFPIARFRASRGILALRTLPRAISIFTGMTHRFLLY